MDNPADNAPISSYSDPIYDRLESLSQKIRRRLSFFIAVLVAALVVAVGVHMWLQQTPMAGSAAAFIKAGEERGNTAKCLEEYAKLVDDTAIVPLFRARAAIEMAQLSLGENKVDDARKHVDKADGIAAKLDNLDLTLVVRLSRAAVELQAGEAAKAEGLYAEVERTAGSSDKYRDRRLAAVLGVAMAQEKQGKHDDAIAKLEPEVNRADNMAKNLLDLARAQYWRLKRAQIEKAAAPKGDAKPAEVKTAPAPAPVPAPVPAAK